MRQKALAFLAKIICRHPWMVLLGWVIAAGISLCLASRLDMMTGRTDLLSPDNPHVRNYTNFTREFGTANNIYFIIESPSLNQSKACADALAAEIGKDRDHIRDVLYKIDLEAMETKLFLHLSRSQLEAVNSYLDENSQLLHQLISAKSLNEFFPAAGALAKKRAEQKFKHPATVSELRALAHLIEMMNSFLWAGERGAFNFLPVVAAGSLPFGSFGDPDGYLVGKNGRILVLAARPNAQKEDSLEFLRPMMVSLLRARENTLKQFPDVAIGVTGLPTFAYGDLRVMEEEMPLLFLLAMLSAVILFLLFFRHPIEILFSGVSLLLALACTLGAAQLLIGHLNIMSSVFAVTLVSLGIDFGIHFIARFHDEFPQADDFSDAMEKALVRAGPPIATGALTTAAAFLLLFFTEFRGLAELGIIAGAGIILCLMSMLTALPSLLVLRHRWSPISAAGRRNTEFLLERILDKSASAGMNHASTIIAVVIAGTLLFCYLAPQIAFDYNFLHIQPNNSTTGDYEEVLMERTGLSPSFSAIVEDDLLSLSQKVERLIAMPSVARVDAASFLMPVHQRENIDAIRRIRDKLEQLERPTRRNHDAVSAAAIIEQFEFMRKGLATALRVQVVTGATEIVDPLVSAQEGVSTFLEHARRADPDALTGNLQEFSREFFLYLEKQLASLADERQLEEVKCEDYPPNVITRFVGSTGKYAAYVFPSQSIWNKEFLDRFNTDILGVVPDATGTTLFAQSLLEISGRALRQSALLVAAALVVLVALDFRKLLPVMLSLLSIALGLIWMLGIMKLLGWQYNPINIMAIPVILGIGIDSSVHIVHRFYDSGEHARTALITSGRAVLVSSLTTIAGFACLLLSTHRGLISLAQLLVLGMITSLAASLVVLPAVLNIIGGTTSENREGLSNLEHVPDPDPGSKTCPRLDRESKD